MPRRRYAALPIAVCALHAQPASAAIDELIEQTFAPIAQGFADAVFASIDIAGTPTPLILLWLIAVAVFCTAYFGFINVRGFAHGFRLIRGDYSDPRSEGEVSHFQALATALSGTVGLGNIAGVAVAIATGGPGATFWMILAGFLGMASKFCECTLGVMFRRQNPDGSISGGPMYYLRDGIARHYPRLAPLGRALGALFAVCCIGGAIGAGNMFQSNGAYQQLLLITGGESSFLAGRAWLFGSVLAVLVGLVIIGGLTTIAKVTGRLVPLMAAIYLLAALVVIGANVEQVPAAFAAIWHGAFTPEGVAGGALGVMLVGFRRAAFSNEAGIGSAPIAHSAVKTREPLTEGFVALWEPFVDTIVICTMTALVIVITGAAGGGSTLTGVELTSAAFASVIGWFPYVLAVAVLLFAYSTMIAYAYYGMKATAYLFGEGRRKEQAFCLLFLAATVVGCTLDVNRVVDFSDAIFFCMAIPNVIGIYLLAPVVKRALRDYRARLARGEIRPSRVAPELPIGSP